jgi:hypothetical protein
MINACTHIHPLASIRRECVLPPPANVLVNVGQKVEVGHVIAETFMPTRHLIFDLPGLLGTTDREALAEMLEHKVGDELQAGDMIARTGSLFSRSIRTPQAGTISAIRDFQVLFAVKPEKKVVRAGFPGTVAQVIPGRGALIEGNGAIIQGVWGNGKTEYGTLVNLCEKPDTQFSADKLDVNQQGAILLGGWCADLNVIRKAVENHVRGIILASMTADLIYPIQEIPIPVLLLEGFGRLAHNSISFKLLSSGNRREIAVSAIPWDRVTGERPECLIPLPTEGSLLEESAFLSAGQTVRVIQAPYNGWIGTIQKIRSGQSLLANGVRTTVADIKFENNDVAALPLVNLDLIG